MAARRMDISALLCDDDDRNDDPASPLISHPVILAPHLRGKHARRMPTTPTASSPSNHNYIPGPRDAPLSSSPTTTESMSDPHHRPRTIDALLHHSPRAPPQISPRPSSSHSHSSVNALLNPHPVRSSSNSSPFTYSLYPQKSPAHPTSPYLPYHAPPPRTGLDALVHAASEERRRISAGSSTSDATSPVADRGVPHADNHSLHPLERSSVHPPRSYPFSYSAPSVPAHSIDDSPRPRKRLRESRSPSPPLEHMHQHYPTLSSVRSAPSALVTSPTASALSSSLTLTGPGMPLPLSGPGITPPHYQPTPVHRSPVLLTHHSPIVPTRMSPIIYDAMRSDRDVPRLARAVWDEEEVDDVRRREDAVRAREREEALRQREEYEHRQRIHEPALDHREDYEQRHRQDLDLRQRQELDLRQRHRDGPDLAMLRQREEILRQQELERWKGEELLRAQEEAAAWQVEDIRGRRQTLHQSPREDVQRQKRDRSSHRQPSLHQPKGDTSLHRPRDPLRPDDIDPRYREQLMRQREQELLRKQEHQQELELQRQEMERRQSEELQRQEMERRQGEELLRQQEETAARQMEEMRIRQLEQRRWEEMALRQKAEREAEARRREEEEAQRLRAEAEAEQRQREELARKLREEEIENRRREEELKRRREAEALERRRLEEEDERRRLEEEVERRRQEEAERRRQEEDAQRLRVVEAELRQHAEAERQRLEREQRRREEEQKRQEEEDRFKREMMLHRQREEALILKQKEEARKLREEREQAERKEREELERKRLEEAEQQAQRVEAERKQQEETERKRAELERKQLEEAEAERLRLAKESERKQQEDLKRNQQEELERQRLMEEQRQREELQWKQREEALRRQQEELARQQQQELERRQELEQMQLDELQQDADVDLGQDTDAELNPESKDRDDGPPQDSPQAQPPHDVSIPPASTSSSPAAHSPARAESTERNLPPMHRGKAKMNSPPLSPPSDVPSKLEEQEICVPSPAHATLPTATQDFMSPPSPTHASSSRESALPSPAPQSPPHKPDPSSMDVDEELLSLLEDGPTSRPTASRSKPKRSPSPQRSSPPDEEVMPPPPTPPVPAKKKAEPAKAGKKKVATAPKPAPKPKPPPKPRTKPPPKTKAKEPTPKDVLKNSFFAKHAAASRSRSASVMPVDAKEELDAEEDSDREDDKLYCVCKTRYDEDRVMIACDRCDEWYHTQCVNMPDLEVDLVDQFICPLCIQSNPQLNLQTTYKRRCFFGLRHTDPSSPNACHKPSRGAFSKYCSNECGVKYMRMNISQYEHNGGKRDRIWETVKNAQKREGVVVCADAKLEIDAKPSAQKCKADREIARLNARLENVVREREMMKREMDMVVWRERLVELASERAERVDECGWDQRLCFGEEEWVDFGAEVLESYEEKANEETTEDGMQVDGVTTSHGEWWCTGKKKCERHSGWQKLRAADVAFDKETKETILSNLTTREREIRKGIEDILYPQLSNTSQAPPKSSPADVPLNGSSKPRINGEAAEKGKKKKS